MSTDQLDNDVARITSSPEVGDEILGERKGKAIQRTHALSMAMLVFRR